MVRKLILRRPGYSTSCSRGPLSLLLIVIFLLVNHACFSQRGLLPEAKPAILKDTVNGFTFVLDSAHQYISAYNTKGNLLWTTYAPSHLLRYLTPDKKKPAIINRWAIDRKNCGCLLEVPEERVIILSYEKCWSHIHLFTGNFHNCGCD